jgi:hypothetical protein
MSPHPNTTPASPSPASPLVDASFDSIESLTTSFATSALPTLETTTVTEVALGYHRNGQYSITAMTTSTAYCPTDSEELTDKKKKSLVDAIAKAQGKLEKELGEEYNRLFLESVEKFHKTRAGRKKVIRDYIK